MSKKEITLSFTSVARYKQAVRILWDNPRYKLIVHGRYLDGPHAGYVTFKKKEAEA